MFRSPLFRSLLAISRSRKNRRRLAAHNRKPVRLVLESLEERLTPSTVIQSAGSYAVLSSLVAGDTAANTNYVINITNSFTFGAGGQVTISKLGTGSALTIQGNNGTNYTLTGNGNRLFDVEGKGQTVTLANLTLTGGGGKSVSQGGAIKDVGGNVSLNGMTVKKNAAVGTATASAQGGGVFVSGGGRLSLTNTLIANNSATGVVLGFYYVLGGGVYVEGASTVTIADSTLSGNKATGAAGPDGTKAGARGGDGSRAYGGGLYVSGSGWTVTLRGDTLSSNAAIGGNGGKGATGADGGGGGSAQGGGLYVEGSGSLTILNDLAAPLTHPSIMTNNTATAGNGGIGGTGGYGGEAGGGGGAAFCLFNDSGDTLNANIGNTTFYGNTYTAGAAGSGGIGKSTYGGWVFGGGLEFILWGKGSVTMLNSTVASNSAIAPVGGNNGGYAYGGGIYRYDQTSDTFVNNTITQNSVSSSSSYAGGIDDPYGTLALINNLIQGNSASPGADLAGGLTNASNNFITDVYPANPVNNGTNIIGDKTLQLGSVVGIGTGGPIYYPLLSAVTSIYAGTTSLLPTIAGMEGNIQPTDEIGGHRTTNGSISLGAVQPLVPDPTTIAPGNASVNYYGVNASPALQIAAEVNDATGGTASGGSVSFSLIANNTTKLLGKAAVGASGVATLSVPAGALPTNLQVGTYQLIESYSGNTFYLASDAIATLSLTTAPTTVVAGNAALNYYGSTTSPAFTLIVGANSPATTVNSGSVAVRLISGNTITFLGSASLGANGVAVVGVKAGILPALPTGSYQLSEIYTGPAGGPFAGSNGSGALTITTAPTTVVAGNAVIGLSGGKTTIPVVVNSPAGVVNSGTVTIKLVNSTTTTALGSASVSGGSASVLVTIPKLPTGSYQLVETYSDSTGRFAGSGAIGTLTIDPPSEAAGSSTVSTTVVESPPPVSPQEAALELAIDAAALALRNNPAALMELEMFSEAFLHYAIPATIPELIGSIRSLDPQTGGLTLSAIGVGMSLAQNLLQKNL